MYLLKIGILRAESSGVFMILMENSDLNPFLEAENGGQL